MRRGFTLVEMVAVLAILAVATHLALHEVSAYRDNRLASLADAQLETIRESVYRLDREGEPQGFLADMGRLVAPTNGTLAELWAQPAGARRYAVVPATSENLVKNMPGRADLVNANVFVGTGWRGPYLALPPGKTRLRDPWGNEIENPDAAGFDRLAVTNGAVVSVSHFGATALEQGRRTRSLVPDGGATSRLIVKAIARDSSPSGEVMYKWYGPCDGLITGAVARVAYGASCTFAGLTPGVRTIWDSLTGLSRLVKIRPGDNQVEISAP